LARPKAARRAKYVDVLRVIPSSPPLSADGGKFPSSISKLRRWRFALSAKPATIKLRREGDGAVDDFMDPLR
jgi:hypothetical protein